ncbi:hypothetical protein JOB18_009246 [Solea senegalensis]|uniref:SH3 domain-binding glutamic acid-rich-like protein n=1 Tax=Solea senegalensis TaxID=28829 RepID=A0AAV6RUG5_SOLSE|nr:SH3 domain-binding glutamic acid-rich-like protein 2 [Solea senegalensis]KAG7508288.1 hypothetical protein JOB18_009246 [Solea senegalensis]
MNYTLRRASSPVCVQFKRNNRESLPPNGLLWIARHFLGIKMVIKVYVASSTGSVAVKKHQQDVVGFLEANRISFQEVDITMLEEQRLWMYKNIPENKQPERGNPLLPQIFSEDCYCGDYEDFFQAKENNAVLAFLRVSSQPLVKDSTS